MNNKTFLFQNDWSQLEDYMGKSDCYSRMITWVHFLDCLEKQNQCPPYDFTSKFTVRGTWACHCTHKHTHSMQTNTHIYTAQKHTHNAHRYYVHTDTIHTHHAPTMHTYRCTHHANTCQANIHVPVQTHKYYSHTHTYHTHTTNTQTYNAHTYTMYTEAHTKSCTHKHRHRHKMYTDMMYTDTYAHTNTHHAKTQITNIPSTHKHTHNAHTLKHTSHAHIYNLYINNNFKKIGDSLWGMWRSRKAGPFSPCHDGHRVLETNRHNCTF